MQLPAYEFAQNLVDLSRVARGDLELSEASTFMKYFNMTGRTLETNPKFFLYSAHAESLGPVLRFFEQESLVPLTPEPASMITFDFYKQDGKFYVEAENVDQESTPFLTLELTKFESMAQAKLQKYS